MLMRTHNQVTSQRRLTKPNSTYRFFPFLAADFFVEALFAGLGAYATQSSSINIFGSANPLSTVVLTGYGF